MEAYLEAQDDSLPMRESGEWVAEKLDYLERYIAIFENSMHSKPWRARHYIDLFAGPGKCIVPKTKRVYLGSPLLALTTAHPFTGYFFVDLAADNIAALQQRCAASPDINHIHFSVGDANQTVREIIARIWPLTALTCKASGRHSIWLFLTLRIDLHWETVSASPQPYRMDLIIHYPQGGLNRSMGIAFHRRNRDQD